MTEPTGTAPASPEPAPVPTADRVADDHLANDRVTSGRVADDRVTSDRVADDHLADDRVTETAEPVPAAAPEGRRRVLRGVLRWSAATVVFAVLGAGAAYAVTVPHRTDLPGLATPPDGRWAFPRLKPVGKGMTTAGNHLTDPRQLLLPAPAGARPDRTLPGRTGWYPAEDFAALYTQPATEVERLDQYACRDIAATGWTMPDGTRERIYLLQFATQPEAAAYAGDLMTDDSLTALPTAQSDPDVPGVKDGVPGSATLNVYDSGKALRPEKARYGYAQQGDIFALVAQTGPRPSSAVPFRQTLTLEAQLLD